MKKVLIGLSVVVALALGSATGFYFYASSGTNAKLAQTWEVHTHAVAIPTPLSEAEVAELREQKIAELTEAEQPTTDEEGEPLDVLADTDLDAIAAERAAERGKHLVEARFACIECHGADFSGGLMVDAPPMGTWLGPNLTSGEGSVVGDYSAEDWDRIVRHGVRKDGTAAIMPSEDFAGMSDQELSDIVTYIGTVPPVDNVVAKRTFGPVPTIMIGMGKMHLAAETFAAKTEHPALPPASAETEEFGKHLAQICTGCHRPDFSGGPIMNGDPAWPPSSNLTGGEGGVGGSYDADSFAKMMTTGVKADGAEALHPMSLITPYAQKMTDTEMKALWLYIASLDPKATGT